MSLKVDLDPCRLEEAGWAAVFPEIADPAIRKALKPLLHHRRRQAGQLRSERYREFTGPDGYLSDESKIHFLARHGVGSGPADPDCMPYYILLVGEPEQIPYSLQRQLGLQYAVGPICFDTPEEYARYAESVVAAERGEFPRPRRVSFFGPHNEGDAATRVCHDLLVSPLALELEGDVHGWEITTSYGPEATKERLGCLLGGDETPALLFAASHGVGYSTPHPNQRRLQGALVCQEWSGPFGSGTSPYFSADDLTGDACPGGLVAFIFASFSAGTPRRNDFVYRDGHESDEVAESPFVARLPQQLLSHPRGGALAVVGHVDRVWTYSFDWPLACGQRQVYAATLRCLMAGHPLGLAMEHFNQNYAELASDLANAGYEPPGRRPRLPRRGQSVDSPQRRPQLPMLVLGDPAVRLAPWSKTHGEESV